MGENGQTCCADRWMILIFIELFSALVAIFVKFTIWCRAGLLDKLAAMPPVTGVSICGEKAVRYTLNMTATSRLSMLAALSQSFQACVKAATNLHRFPNGEANDHRFWSEMRWHCAFAHWRQPPMEEVHRIFRCGLSTKPLGPFEPLSSGRFWAL